MIRHIIHREVKETIEVDSIDFSVSDIRYRTERGSECKLQFLGEGIGWGFVYLNRPALKPVFVRNSARHAVLDAMNKHNLTHEKCSY